MGAQNNLRRTSCGADFCSWCGQSRRRTYRYGVLRGVFCNFGCAAAFHDIDRKNFDYLEMT